MKKRLFKWLKILVAAYLIIGIGLYFFQEKFLFHPKAFPKDFSYWFPGSFNELTIPYDSSTSFSIVQFTLPKYDTGSAKEMGYERDTACKGVVLYFHGNMENINRYAKFSGNFTVNGYEVWMCDYPSFGKSTGKINEEILYEEAKQMYLLAKTKFPANKIIIYGKSLGTGIAAQLASTQQCSRLILETPYYSLSSVMKHYAPIYPVEATTKYKMPSFEYFKKIEEPITIFHGTDDGVIPYSNATKLKMVMKPTDEFITIENGTHNNLNDFPLFHQKLDSLLK
jgi:pimeloyl-ACP methyl ester carboxylesterase